MLRIRTVYPGSEFFPSRTPDPHKRNWSNLTPQKIVSKLSEIWSRLFIPDPDPDFLPNPDPGPRGQKGTGSRGQKGTGIPDPQHCKRRPSTICFPALPSSVWRPAALVGRIPWPGGGCVRVGVAGRRRGSPPPHRPRSAQSHASTQSAAPPRRRSRSGSTDSCKKESQ